MDFSYTHIKIPDCSFKISPSGISKFFDMPSIWYKEHILGEAGFEGSTASVLGTVIHAIAEAYAKGEDTSRELVDAYLDTINKNRKVTLPLIDTDEIKSLYPDMSMTLVNEYVRKNPPTEVEQPIYTKVLDDIYVGGTCDNLTGDTVVDYKNVSKKPNTETIPFGYLIQLLAYARCYKDNGTPINRVRIVYTVRPTKTLPVRVFTVTHTITPDDWELIDNSLLLIAETVQAVRENPLITHLLFKSYKLKEA